MNHHKFSNFEKCYLEVPTQNLKWVCFNTAPLYTPETQTFDYPFRDLCFRQWFQLARLSCEPSKWSRTFQNKWPATRIQMCAQNAMEKEGCFRTCCLGSQHLRLLQSTETGNKAEECFPKPWIRVCSMYTKEDGDLGKGNLRLEARLYP